MNQIERQGKKEISASRSLPIAGRTIGAVGVICPSLTTIRRIVTVVHYICT